jgi:hypothetical protein
MNKQYASRTTAKQAVMSGRFAELRLADDAIADEFDWESETMYQGKTFSGDVLGYIMQCD